MRFEVPQFIDVEDKLFGPLTFTQFIYLAGAGGISFAIWALGSRFLPFIPFFVLVAFMIPFVMFGVALAFYKHNNRPFIVLVESWFNYMMRGKFYIWKKREKKPEEEVQEVQVVQQNSPLYIPKLSDSKLKDLSWSLDVQEKRRGEVL